MRRWSSHPEAIERIRVCRAFIEERIAAGEIMYGVNTGIGEFSEVVLDDDQIQRFPALPHLQPCRGHRRAVRPSITCAAPCCCAPTCTPTGHSACRPEITQTLDRDAQQGRDAGGVRKGLGGRLRRPRAHEPDRAAHDGRGRGFLSRARDCRGTRRWRRPASRFRGSRPATAWPLSTAPTCSTASARLAVYDAERWLKQAEIAAAMTLEALKANMKPYDTRLHELRGFRGRRDLRRQPAPGHGRAPTCSPARRRSRCRTPTRMRSTPQVIGAARDQLRWTREPDRDRGQRRRRQSDLPRRGQGRAHRAPTSRARP